MTSLTVSPTNSATAQTVESGSPVLPAEIAATGPDTTNELHLVLKGERIGDGYLVRFRTREANYTQYGISVARDHQSTDPSEPFHGMATGSLGSAHVTLDLGCDHITIHLVRTEPNKPREEYRFFLEIFAVAPAPAPGSDAPIEGTQADPARWSRAMGANIPTQRLCLAPPLPTHAHYIPPGVDPTDIPVFGVSRGKWSLDP